MSALSDLDLQLTEIHQAMAEPYPPGTPQQLVEERIHRLESEMIELCALTLDPEQNPLIRENWHSIAQIRLRAQFILTYFDGADLEPVKRLIAGLDEYRSKPRGLRIVRHGF